MRAHNQSDKFFVEVQLCGVEPEFAVRADELEQATEVECELVKNTTLSEDRSGALIRARVPSIQALPPRKARPLRLGNVIGVGRAGLSNIRLGMGV